MRAPGDVAASARRCGVNLVRLRVLVGPTRLSPQPDELIELAVRYHCEGFRILLDFFYSDTWADPGAQPVPSAWRSMDLDELVDAVTEHTVTVLENLRRRGVEPAFVQIGNEISAGMLFEHGRIARDGGRGFRRLVGAALESARTHAPHARTILHYHSVSDPRAVARFLDVVVGLDFDVLGLSYYPWWHGDLDQFASGLHELKKIWDRPVLLVETAYPWTLDWQDATHNVVGLVDQLLPGYPASPAGQRDFLIDVARRGQRALGEQFLGVVVFEPAWTAGESPWENLTFFDDAGRLLPAANSLRGTVGAAAEARGLRRRQRP